MRKAAARLSPGDGTTFQTPFFPVSFGKVSRKSVQPFPRTVVSYFFCERKKQKKQKTEKNICKNIRYRLIGGCVN